MPVISDLASTYRGKVSFVAVAGKSDIERTAEVAGSLLNRNVKWGLDDSIWDLYGVRGQPITLIIDRGVIVGELFGNSGVGTLTARINELI